MVKLGNRVQSSLYRELVGVVCSLGPQACE